MAIIPANMRTYRIFDKEISGPFTIPSGIITTTVDSMQLYAETIPAVGILTTKSISKKAKKGNPTPILEQVTEWEFRNAVGLANPGVNNFIKELKEWQDGRDGDLLFDKFLLGSVFGENIDEFVYVAGKLAPYVHGIELNVSCPHADRGGALFGADPDITLQIVERVKLAVDVPVITKLTPNCDDIGAIADAALAAGSDGLCAINTWKALPSSVLSKGKGGTSGRRIKQTALDCIKKISRVIKKYEKTYKRKIPLIGMGGIYNSADVLEFNEAGADFFGVGTALFDKTHKQQKDFLEKVCRKYEAGERDYSGSGKAKKRLMKYKDLTIQDVIELSDDLRAYQFKEAVQCKPGNFMMLWIPGVSENPFSVANSWPLTIIVKKHERKDNFTSALWELKKKDKLKARGPYGNSFPLGNQYIPREHVLVAGGVGAAPLYGLAFDLRGNLDILIGARSSNELLTDIAPSIAPLTKFGRVQEITDDGSSGRKGFVTDLLEEYLANTTKKFNIYVCGPEMMMKKALEMASEHPGFVQGYASVERYMKCGMGACNSCEMDGKSTCKNGPVKPWDELKESKDFGFYKRDASGKKIEI